jgi:hypothetical protein
MLHESEEEEMDTYAIELNSFVDTILTKVYDMGSGRDILFSSFNPDICLLLSFKQPSIPVPPQSAISVLAVYRRPFDSHRAGTSLASSHRPSL